MATVVRGNVTIGANEQPMTITRRQLEESENVEVFLVHRALTWRAEEGARAASTDPTQTERQIIERIVYDSPDYFVLAQLRGASYYTVMRNIRPDNSPDNYDGPLWTVVRVDESASNELETQLVSRWRLFYLNSISGLIDKIVTEEQGQRIEATLSDWMEQSGEKFPATITWNRNGELVMTLKVTNLSTATIQELLQ